MAKLNASKLKGIVSRVQGVFYSGSVLAYLGFCRASLAFFLASSTAKPTYETYFQGCYGCRWWCGAQPQIRFLVLLNLVSILYLKKI